jgi:hypothetical protein
MGRSMTGFGQVSMMKKRHGSESQACAINADAREGGRSQRRLDKIFKILLIDRLRLS